MTEIRFTAEAIDDLVGLDGSVRPRVLKKILLLEENPEAGQPLGARGGNQLATFRKLTVGDRQWRIVYRVEPSGEVVVIWVVANREDSEVYAEAARRLSRIGTRETVGMESIASRLRRPTRGEMQDDD